MAQDLRKLLKEDTEHVSNQKMSSGHEARFLTKLEKALPKEPSSNRFRFLNIAASMILILGLSFAAYKFIQSSEAGSDTPPQELVNTRTIEDVSPELKKVEDYYLASINLELSKIEYSPENKELFDGYVERLGQLSEEYKILSQELINSGPNEQTVTALIDNLKLRLNLLQRLKDKLSELQNNDYEDEKVI